MTAKAAINKTATHSSDPAIESTFRTVLDELIDENVLACSAILSLSELRFTREVPTLCVTCTDRPVLCVNPDFLREHTRNDTDVKAVILHEFLHVLLGHTLARSQPSPALNIAWDTVINHLIQREFGEAYGEVFRRYYKRSKGLTSLLGPWTRDQLDEVCRKKGPLLELRRKLYRGRVIAEDVLELVEQLQDTAKALDLPDNRHFIGNHDSTIPWESLSREISTALSRTKRSLAGQDILGRSDMENYTELWKYSESAAASMGRWERETLALLERCITPDQRGRPEWKPQQAFLPVLHPGARRSVVQALWSPLFTDVPWDLQHREASGTCQVYLDVSGSMFGVMPALIALLGHFGARIRRPFWGFSTEVAPARIVRGSLECNTSGGTSINCVLDHVRKTRPQRVLIITDGVVEIPCPQILAALRADGQEVCALISHDGAIDRIQSAGIPCHQLSVQPEATR